MQPLLWMLAGAIITGLIVNIVAALLIKDIADWTRDLFDEAANQAKSVPGGDSLELEMLRRFNQRSSGSFGQIYVAVAFNMRLALLAHRPAQVLYSVLTYTLFWVCMGMDIGLAWNLADNFPLMVRGSILGLTFILLHIAISLGRSEKERNYTLAALGALGVLLIPVLMTLTGDGGGPPSSALSGILAVLEMRLATSVWRRNLSRSSGKISSHILLLSTYLLGMMGMALTVTRHAGSGSVAANAAWAIFITTLSLTALSRIFLRGKSSPNSPILSTIFT